MRLSIQNPSKGKAFARELYCLNCRAPLPSDVRGIDARRFCSEECKQEYLASANY